MKKLARLLTTGFKLARIRYEDYGDATGTLYCVVYAVRFAAINWKRPVEDFDKSFGD